MSGHGQDPADAAGGAAADSEVTELRKEALTMALYVAVCLLAAFLALPEDSAELHVGALIWGLAIGLAVVHWFAFQVSARVVGAGHVRPRDVRSAAAQLVGAGVVAALATIPVLVFRREAGEIFAVELVLAGFIGFVGFGVARSGGATTVRAFGYAVIVLAIAVVLAVMKNALGGH